MERVLRANVPAICLGDRVNFWSNAPLWTESYVVKRSFVDRIRSGQAFYCVGYPSRDGHGLGGGNGTKLLIPPIFVDLYTRSFVFGLIAY